ncbi:MAG: SMC-Scp complex subunit ScpB [Litorivicinaceae bacterium]|jgi:segregation and condensation protein B|nr:SMC-Scp complex subunit ScpB [Litorivicinaceae bacterium]MDP5329686.1 SMC-Scp complex subunit ScpB [Litorivicinaceae bacterium]MDP5331140.1 SMC-Scp complex subunit ScpB [Litorivicinaceae bacterium]MDP5340873.1 SMC-Scp complex subunit ScpB [Litorivicinaceae bacterium]MDP5342906.1 SMC-Scp complex subunit ScpB [Litorivicinaceae bacterium]
MAELSLVRVIEGVLFAAREPVSIQALKKVFEEGPQNPSEGMLREALSRLAAEYADRSVQLVEVATGFRFQVVDAVSPYLARLSEEKPGRYSRAMLETLAMICYRQPVTRGEIESVRGVAVGSPIIRTLEERGWIHVVGHKDVPGRPALFATTRQFLDDFGLKSLDQLPLPKGVQSRRSEDLLDGLAEQINE